MERVRSIIVQFSQYNEMYPGGGKGWSLSLGFWGFSDGSSRQWTFLVLALHVCHFAISSSKILFLPIYTNLHSRI